MVEVARLAGVSQQTVSRVVNGNPNVGKDVFRRVDEAIRQLDYRPNKAARALATNRSMNLGVISFGLAQYGPSVALFGIAEEARRHGYATSLVTLGDVDKRTIQSALDHLTATSVDGVLVLAPVQAARVALSGMDYGIPLVVFDPGSEGLPNHVAVDEVRGARLATRHLLELGHETVWHVRGPAGWTGAEARVRGWAAELSAQHRFAPDTFDGDWTSESGYRAGQLVAADPRITAVLVANDQMALGLMKALSENAVHIPGDVSVVGFDDIPESAYFRPSLTTVRLDFDEVGSRAFDRILDLMKGARTDDPIPLIASDLILRDTTGPPPSRARGQQTQVTRKDQ
ncbi:LacI family DNA-binding transcriptional regulator [Herbiconiux sp. CPCC 203386]|uniref:LacI family DNA-binding transcriptional regulator n=2 Tax=Herbiconiux daphne TaxID=2970914 RepID=A0ABT2H465_9MICO|nr:LacI family DNA-binding transcriptional regulator [Herbiconiux daphne]